MNLLIGPGYVACSRLARKPKEVEMVFRKKKKEPFVPYYVYKAVKCGNYRTEYWEIAYIKVNAPVNKAGMISVDRSEATKWAKRILASDCSLTKEGAVEAAIATLKEKLKEAQDELRLARRDLLPVARASAKEARTAKRRRVSR